MLMSVRYGLAFFFLFSFETCLFCFWMNKCFWLQEKLVSHCPLLCLPHTLYFNYWFIIRLVEQQYYSVLSSFSPMYFHFSLDLAFPCTDFPFSIHCISNVNTANSPLWMLHLFHVSFSLLILEVAGKNGKDQEKVDKYEKYDIWSQRRRKSLKSLHWVFV